MKIATVQIHIYRQASTIASKRADDAAQNLPGTRSAASRSVTLPSANPAEAASVTVPKGPSLLSGALSSEEKELLVRYFARFGDTVEAAPTYSPVARPAVAYLTGQKVDVRG